MKTETLYSLYSVVFFSILTLGVTHVSAMQEPKETPQDAQEITQSPETIVPLDRMPEVKQAWGEVGSSLPLYAIQGRPDRVSPTWDGFVAKVEKDGIDYTIFTNGTPRKPQELNPEQLKLLSLVKSQDTKAICQTIDTSRSTAIYREPRFLSEFLALVWDKNFRVKATAIFLLALLTKEQNLPTYKEQKLPAYAYRVWGQAAIEGNYKYQSDPFFEPGTCRTWIRQLGIHAIPTRREGDSMGLSHATCMPGGISMPLVRRTISEDFYIVSGQGEFVINDGTREIKFEAKPGTYFANPSGMHIQFRNTGNVLLTMFVPTFPPYDVVIPFPSETEYSDPQSRFAAYLKRTDEEIHKVHGQQGAGWNLPEYNALVEIIKKDVEDLLKTDFGHKQATENLVNPLAKYLHRYFINELPRSKLTGYLQI